MKKIICYFILSFAIVGCSTTGGLYSKDDPANNEFSVGNTILGILGAVATVGLAASGGGSGGGYGNSYTPVDYDWAWDQFYNQYGQLTWACRGKQTGQFAYNSSCAYKTVNDLTWPSK
jgi:hypothetical protein